MSTSAAFRSLSPLNPIGVLPTIVQWGILMNTPRLTSEQQVTVKTMMVDAERIAHYLYGRLSDDELSECYVALCKAVATHDPSKSSLGTWLYNCIRNQLSTHKRKEAKQPIPFSQLKGDWSSIPARESGTTIPLLLNPLPYNQIGIEGEEILDCLPSRHRAIFRAWALQGESLDTISAREKVSKQRVHQIVCWCREKLKRALDCSSDDTLTPAKRSTKRRRIKPAQTVETVPASSISPIVE